jgi:hypothetical protein
MKNFNVFKGYQSMTVFDPASGTFIDCPVTNTDFLDRTHATDKTLAEKASASQLRQSVASHRIQRPRTARQAP